MAAAVLLALGMWLCSGRGIRARPGWMTGTPLAITGLLVGVVGGIYGLGGGSLLGPMLVGAGLSVARVAPAALASTLVTSTVGVGSYALLSLFTSGSVRPHWAIGLSCGLGGLVGGYVGARLQPHLPEAVLRALLGTVAVGLAALYILQAHVSSAADRGLPLNALFGWWWADPVTALVLAVVAPLTKTRAGALFTRTGWARRSGR